MPLDTPSTDAVGDVRIDAIQSAKASWVPVLAISAIVIGVSIVATYYLLLRYSDATATNLHTGTITIGYTPWAGYVGFYVAEEKGFFKDEGVDVEFMNYISIIESSHAYMAGTIQGLANLTHDAVLQTQAGLEHRIVLTIDYSNGPDGIIAVPDITRIRDIRGRRVAFEFGTLEEFFLRHALAKNDMTIADVLPVNRDPEESAMALVAGEVDAAVTYEPYMGQALAVTDGNIIYSSSDAPGLIKDVLSFREDFIEEDPDSVRAIIRAYFRGLRYWKEHPEESNAIVAKRIGTDVERVQEQLRGLHVLDEDDNRTALTFSVGPESLYGNLRSVSKFIQEQQGTTTKAVYTDTMIDSRFVRALAR